MKYIGGRRCIPTGCPHNSMTQSLVEQIRVKLSMRLKELKEVVDRKQLSDSALDLVAMRFRSLGEPMRLKILRLLEGGEMTVGQLVEQLNSSQANISKHLKVLVSAGILARRAEGTAAYYSITDPVILKVCDTVCGGLAERLKVQAEGFGFKLTPQRGSR